ncbi:MAG: universal stress protein [Dehalococcoidia bacterium]
MRNEGPILVPLDGSELAEGALPYAVTLAKVLRAPLALLTVWEGTESELGATFPALALEVEQKATQHFATYLEGVKGRMKGMNVETLMRSGEAGEETLRAITESGARMIVIATHGRSGVGRWMYGSTAGHLLRHAQVPVVAVGPHALARSAKDAAFRHLMIPLDGSKLSEEALPVARQLAAAAKARLSLVRAVRWAVQAYPYTLPETYVPQIDEELEAGARAYLKRQREAVTDVEADAFVVRGAIAEGLIDFVEKEKVDLVVMTTHARAGLARAALGSTADRLLQGAAPVMLIRPDAP